MRHGRRCRTAPGAVTTTVGSTPSVSDPLRRVARRRPRAQPVRHDEGAAEDDDVDLYAADEDLSTAHFWLLERGPALAAVAVVLLLFVVTAYAGSSAIGGDPDGAARTSEVPRECVRQIDGRNAVRVGCNDANDGRIMTRVDRPLDCPPGTSYVVLDESITCVTSDPSLSSNMPPQEGGG